MTTDANAREMKRYAHLIGFYYKGSAALAPLRRRSWLAPVDIVNALKSLLAIAFLISLIPCALYIGVMVGFQLITIL